MKRRVASASLTRSQANAIGEFMRRLAIEETATATMAYAKSRIAKSKKLKESLAIRGGMHEARASFASTLAKFFRRKRVRGLINIG